MARGGSDRGLLIANAPRQVGDTSDVVVDDRAVADRRAEYAKALRSEGAQRRLEAGDIEDRAGFGVHVADHAPTGRRTGIVDNAIRPDGTAGRAKAGRPATRLASAASVCEKLGSAATDRR